MSASFLRDLNSSSRVRGAATFHVYQRGARAVAATRGVAEEREGVVPRDAALGHPFQTSRQAMPNEAMTAANAPQHRT